MPEILSAFLFLNAEVASITSIIFFHLITRTITVKIECDSERIDRLFTVPIFL